MVIHDDEEEDEGYFFIGQGIYYKYSNPYKYFPCLSNLLCVLNILSYEEDDDDVQNNDPEEDTDSILEVPDKHTHW
jgi:hypothetical protein